MASSEDPARRKARRLVPSPSPAEETEDVITTIWKQKGKLALSLLRTREAVHAAVDLAIVAGIQHGTPITFARFTTAGGRPGMVALVLGEDESLLAWDKLAELGLNKTVTPEGD